MARINFDLQKYDGEFMNAGMDRLRKAAAIIRDAAREKVPQWGGPFWGPYKSGKYAGVVWTARDYQGLLNTIRVVEKHDQFAFGVKIENKNVWVMAGNFRQWYAKQVEYGRGRWKGGAHPFLRPALHQSEQKVRSIIEGG